MNIKRGDKVSFNNFTKLIAVFTDLSKEQANDKYEVKYVDGQLITIEVVGRDLTIHQLLVRKVS